MSDLEPTGKVKSAGPRQRSRAGCWQCRSKTVKKRCNQERPQCGRCCRLNLECDYAPRPTLAERRKKEKADKLHPPSSPTPEPPSHALCVSLAAPTNSASSLDLSPADREAIHHFRFVFPKSHHVNNTDYSLITLMFELASDDPMLMHMVIAISLQEMNARRMVPDHKAIGQSVQHYSDALRLVSNAISPNIGVNDLDAICTALWMMLLYEQQFGDAQYTAFRAHLAGLSSFLQYQFGRTLRFSNSTETGSESVVMIKRTRAHDPTILSAYSARLLVWISLMDSAAASAGIGGQVNITLLKNLLGNESNLSPAPKESINAFASLRRYSAPLYRLAWGPEYPQNELRVDMEMADAYILLTECVILRFVVAQLATELYQGPASESEKIMDVQRAILEVRRKFTRLFDIARELSVETKHTPVNANIRTIVPFFYAVVLDFFRLTSFNKPLGEQQRLALKSIMNLAFQNRRHGGIEAMVKMAWSLFIAALESEDRMEQDWILQQFQALSKFGCNFKRAHDFLLNNIPIQQVTGKRVDIRARMQESALFVLG